MVRARHLTRFALDPDKSAPQAAPAAPAPSSAPLKPAHNNYRILRWLGEGAMAVVYEAEHVEIHRRVALKVLRPEVTSDEAHVRAFRDEARATSRAGSPYIVDVFDFGVLDDGRVWLAMELLKGNSLAEFCGKRMEVGRLIGILRQVCKGLHAAHGAGLVHRDIKPENIMLSERDERQDAVKIVDFGIATLLADAAPGQQTVAGTPYYMAPEHITGGEFDHRLDIYAVGCLAYEMLTGELPFDGDSVGVILKRHVKEAPAPPSQICDPDTVPRAFETVIMRCLAKEPDERYRDMADLEAALCEAAVEDEIVTPWDDLPFPAEMDPERRQRLLMETSNEAHVQRVSARRWLWPVTLVAAVLLTVGVTLAVVPDPSAAPVVDSTVTDLAREAHEAAARAAFVYPPADEPDAPTAYTKIRELEQLEGPNHEQANARAAELRVEFAETLVRLGDRRWEDPEGRTFATDFYTQALVFLPGHRVAAERAAVSPEMLASLRYKAATLEFDKEELDDNESMVAMSDEFLAEPARRRRYRRRKQIEQQPDDAPPEVKYALTDAPTEALGAGIEPESKRASGLAERGKKALAKGRYLRAEGLFERALEQDPGSITALVGMTRIQLRRNAYPRASWYAERAIKVAPGAATAHLLLGDAYRGMARNADARRAYEKARELGNGAAVGRLAKL